LTFRSEQGEVAFQGFQSIIAGKAVAHYEIRASSAGLVGKLALEDGLDVVFTQMALGADAMELHARGGRHGDDQIHAPIGSGFEQQRNVEHADGGAGSSGAGQEGVLSGAD